ncbi:MAG: flippase-like domain-containing protein [Ignavibacteria bacterium]|nr:flippase-like domain-containing protein [Ignavibacteria bacterium]
MKNLQKKIILGIVIAAVVYLGFSLYIDFNKLLEAFSLFDFKYFPIVLALSLFNYLLRFERWHYYLNVLEIKIPRKISYSIFFGGLIMSITPGKVGELLKSYLIKEYNGTSIHKSAPVILVERLGDFVSLLLVAMVGAIYFNFGRNIVLITLIIFGAFLFGLSYRPIAEPVIKYMSRLKFLHKISEKILVAYENSYKLLRPVPLFSMLILAAIAWGFEALGLYVILKVFNTDASFFWSLFVYSFSTIIGGLLLVPGGIGPTEGSLTLLLVRTNIPLNISFVATFLIRVATLWFAILMGIVGLIYFQKKIVHKKVFEIETNEENGL